MVENNKTIKEYCSGIATEILKLVVDMINEDTEGYYVTCDYKIEGKLYLIPYPCRIKGEPPKFVSLCAIYENNGKKYVIKILEVDFRNLDDIVDAVYLTYLEVFELIQTLKKKNND